ncbi:MAG: PIG-L family deacetylase [Clostridiales bacterium]|jgi:LmbE family N-acetylglucosaminyl deacetylase|nr:PIG-L family deacetylase [Clostridiales bacterium]
MSKNIYVNLRTETFSENINLLFPDWEQGNERIAVFSPHDDDALIGAGYAMAAAMDEGAEVYVVVFCQGDCGYKNPDEKDSIVRIREKENLAALTSFDIPEKNIFRFEYPDFSTTQYMGYHLPNGELGSFPKIIEFIRKNKITRLLMPNDYREHTDHTAVFNMAAFEVIQAGDPIVSDIGEGQKVKNMLQYSVWSDFSPHDMLVSNGKRLLRANRAIVCPKTVEDKVRNAIREYQSQDLIIEDLFQTREERFTGTGYIELYIDFNPRPKLDYHPYVHGINEILNSNK